MIAAPSCCIPQESIEAAWAGTIARIETQFPTSPVSLYIVDHDEMESVIASGNADFVLVDPGQCVDFESRLGISRLATMVRQVPKSRVLYWHSAGAIFTHAGRDDIEVIGDLRGKSLIRPSPRSFLGLAVVGKLVECGVDPATDLSAHTFDSAEEVLLSVLIGRVDAGTLSCETLAQMIARRKLQWEDIKLLNAQASPGFPFPYSTDLFPQWQLASLAGTDPACVRSVAGALLAVNGRASGDTRHIPPLVAGWALTWDSRPVHRLYARLGLGPYRVSESAHRAPAVQNWWPVSRAAAHEFKTPLNVIMSMSDLMRELPGIKGDEEVLYYVNQILSSGECLVDLVDSLVDLIRVETDNISLQTDVVTAASIFEDIQHALEERGFQILFSLDLPESVVREQYRIDGRRLTRIMIYLIAQIDKAHPGQPIGIHARSERGRLRIGCECDEVFNAETAFASLAGAGSCRAGSSEFIRPARFWFLLSHRVIEAMGGRMWLEEKGDGLNVRTAWIEIPTVPSKIS